MRERRISFNPDSIKSCQELATTLTAVAIEASPRENTKRIYEYELIATPDGKVVNPELNPEIDMEKQLSWDTELHIRESRVALQIKSALLTKPDGTIMIWFSPPNEDLGYSEGRINIGYKTTEGCAKLQSYGIVTTDISPEEMLTMSDKVSEFSLDSFFANDPEDLRDNAIFIKLPEYEECPWSFLQNYIPLEGVWDEIINGNASLRKNKINKNSQQVAEKIYPLLQISGTYHNRLALALKAEQMMAEMGNPIDHDRLCATLSIPNPTHTHTLLGSGGQVLYTNKENGVFVKKCPFCNKVINKIIHAGYKCTCGQTYEGVC